MRFVVFCSILCLALWCGRSFGRLSYDPTIYQTRDLGQDVQRPQGCAAKRYTSLSAASVIITAQDEKPKIMETLVKSILHKTAPELLESIIIVDDGSQSFPVQDSLKHYPGVHIIHNPQPLGIAASRMAGAAEAQGSVLVFLDSHMEVTDRWLEPLLEYIHNNPLSVVASVIDPIEETGVYASSPNISLVTLNQETSSIQWTSTIAAQPSPLESPLFLGSGFAVSKKWWNKSGRYDPAFQAWGMENVELSVKSWTCGTGVVFHPCSHVGRYLRLNRDETDTRYKDDSFMRANAIRFAEVWMDDFKTEFYNRRGISQSEVTSVVSGDEGLTARQEMRKGLDCKPFSWFLDDVVKRIGQEYNVKPISYNPAALTLSSASLLPRNADETTATTTDSSAVAKRESSQVPPPYDATYTQSFRMDFNYVRGKNGPNCPTHAWGTLILPTSALDTYDNPPPDYATYTLKSGITLSLHFDLGTLSKTYTQDDDRRIYINPEYDAAHHEDFPQVYMKQGVVAGINWSVKDATRRHVTFNVERVRFGGSIPNPTATDPEGDWKISHCVADLDFVML